jgi:hypothetical protein
VGKYVGNAQVQQRVVWDGSDGGFEEAFEHPGWLNAARRDASLAVRRNRVVTQIAGRRGCGKHAVAEDKMVDHLRTLESGHGVGSTTGRHSFGQRRD